jgi:hypothetical protein
LKVWNIYNKSTDISLQVDVLPGCSEAAGCGPKLYIYTGETLEEAAAKS